MVVHVHWVRHWKQTQDSSILVSLVCSQQKWFLVSYPCSFCSKHNQQTTLEIKELSHWVKRWKQTLHWKSSILLVFFLPFNGWITCFVQETCFVFERKPNWWCWNNRSQWSIENKDRNVVCFIGKSWFVFWILCSFLFVHCFTLTIFNSGRKRRKSTCIHVEREHNVVVFDVARYIILLSS